MAVLKGLLPVLKLLTQKGCSLDQRDRQGNTLLHLCAITDQEVDELQMITYLIENGLKITTPNYSGKLAHSMTTDVSRKKLLNTPGDLPNDVEPPNRQKSGVTEKRSRKSSAQEIEASASASASEQLDYGLASPDPKIEKFEDHDDQFIQQNSVDGYTKRIQGDVAAEEEQKKAALKNKGKASPTSQQSENAESEMSENDNGQQ
jgi:hypothetical protein